MNEMKRGIAALLVAGVALLGPRTAPGQGKEPIIDASGLSRDEKLNLLKTRQAELELEKAKAEMERAKLELEDTRSLFEEGIETINKLRKAEQTHKEAEIRHSQAKIQLEQTRLEFLKNATLIRVLDAQIFRGDAGDVMASIELQNDSDINKARVIMTREEEGARISDEELADLLKVNNIIVTLWGSAQPSSSQEDFSRSQTRAIIGDPFQRIVAELKSGENVKLDFRLLKREVEHVAVQIEYLETSKEYDVFLKKEALEDLPTIVSAQYDQHGDLGSTIKYNLQLERLGRTDQSFSLRVLNFPEEIRFAFVDPKTEAKMTTLKFSSEETIRMMDFEVRIPEKLGRDLIDKSIAFYIVVAQQKEMEKIHDLRKKYGDQEVPAEEIAKIQGNVAELVLIPKGVGKLDLLVGNLFKEALQGEGVVLKFSALNSGTFVVNRIRPKMNLPLDWEGEIAPEEAESLEPDQKILFTADIRPPEDVVVGEYTITVETEGHSGVELIDAKEKDFTVRVVASGNITGTMALVALLVALVLGIAVASVKIARR
ncbi:MAG TPA: NEW3 domain-containing protein [Sumerlaeia bacterium]|nr:NEW3 domain-containing protein [Sumerlaeia bacterium]